MDPPTRACGRRETERERRTAFLDQFNKSRRQHEAAAQVELILRLRIMTNDRRHNNFRCTQRDTVNHFYYHKRNRRRTEAFPSCVTHARRPDEASSPNQLRAAMENASRWVRCEWRCCIGVIASVAVAAATPPARNRSRQRAPRGASPKCSDCERVLAIHCCDGRCTRQILGARVGVRVARVRAHERSSTRPLARTHAQRRAHARSARGKVHQRNFASSIVVPIHLLSRTLSLTCLPLPSPPTRVSRSSFFCRFLCLSLTQIFAPRDRWPVASPPHAFAVCIVRAALPPTAHADARCIAA